MVQIRAWGVAPEFAAGETDLGTLIVEITVADDSDGTIGAGDTVTFNGTRQTVAEAWLDAFFINGERVEVAALHMVDGSSFSIPLVDGVLSPAYPAISTGVELGPTLPPILFPTSDIICFARGTKISVQRGDVLVEALRVGDLVATKDRGMQSIRWIGSTKLDAAALALSPNLRPIRIRAGALGRNVPADDLTVSPQHRILVRSMIAQRMFNTNEVLVAAKQLLEVNGVEVANELQEVEYFHLLFDQHEVIVANGAETESLYTGPQALKSVGAAAREEILSLFPELETLETAARSARELVPGRKARQLAVRHRQNGQALVS